MTQGKNPKIIGTLVLVFLAGGVTGAMVMRNGQTWFYKLMGDANVVAGQKDAFLNFVKAVKY